MESLTLYDIIKEEIIKSNNTNIRGYFLTKYKCPLSNLTNQLDIKTYIRKNNNKLVKDKLIIRLIKSNKCISVLDAIKTILCFSSVNDFSIIKERRY